MTEPPHISPALAAHNNKSRVHIPQGEDNIQYDANALERGYQRPTAVQALYYKQVKFYGLVGIDDDDIEEFTEYIDTKKEDRIPLTYTKMLGQLRAANYVVKKHKEPGFKNRWSAANVKDAEERVALLTPYFEVMKREYDKTTLIGEGRIYYGIGDVPEGKRLCTPLQACKAGQVRYWGLVPISKELQQQYFPDTILPKRKRGRPTIIKVPIEKKPRGRPTLNKPPVKKNPRGRPKKTVTFHEDSNTLLTDMKNTQNAYETQRNKLTHEFKNIMGSADLIATINDMKKTSDIFDKQRARLTQDFKHLMDSMPTPNRNIKQNKTPDTDKDMFDHVPQNILIRAIREYCDLHDTDTDAVRHIERYFDSDSSTSKSSIIRSLLSQEKQKKYHIDGEKILKISNKIINAKKSTQRTPEIKTPAANDTKIVNAIFENTHTLCLAIQKYLLEYPARIHKKIGITDDDKLQRHIFNTITSEQSKTELLSYIPYYDINVDKLITLYNKIDKQLTLNNKSAAARAHNKTPPQTTTLQFSFGRGRKRIKRRLKRLM